MADQADVERIASSLPEATTDNGLHFNVRGKGFAWPWLERIHPRKARVPNLDVLVLPVANEGEKFALVEADPEKFFTEPHYNGYSAVMVRLAAIGVDELEEMIVDAWRIKAPTTLVREYDAER